MAWNLEGTDVSGSVVAAVADTPKVMTDGDWRMGVLIDEGGPMEALSPLVGENLGMERPQIDIDEDGLRHSIKIGDSVDVEVEDIVPFGVETGKPARLTGIFHPAGSELNVAHTTRSHVNAFGMEFETKSGFSTSNFSWAA